MNRKKFIQITGGAILAAGIATYLLSDKYNFVRADENGGDKIIKELAPGEREILYLASLAPSGHNTQPWRVRYSAPYHWIIENDQTRWLPAVDPTQRETILSIGAFMQNIEYAASSLGYECSFRVLARTNQENAIAEVILSRKNNLAGFDSEKIKTRRTLRSGYSKESIRPADLVFLTKDDAEHIHYISNTSKEYHWLNDQTIEANRVQALRDDAQQELGEWMRFSSKHAAAHLDGLTTASMELAGIPAWFVRNFYSSKDVMSQDFRKQTMIKITSQVNSSGGWFIISSKDAGTETLLRTGMRFQRLFLKVRERNIALHPMTQILEETATVGSVEKVVGLTNPVQFILRTGYVKNYPPPVSLRRPLNQLITFQL